MPTQITHIKQKNIDRVKYDACINSASNTRVYACSWYLDILTHDWEVLVWGDYDAVLPIPYIRAKKFLLFKNIIQPTFCQQLGVFYNAKKVEKGKFDTVLTQFLSKLIDLQPKSYSFNAQNIFVKNKQKTSFLEKVNYELNLNTPYLDLQANYAKNTKRNGKKAVKHALKIVKNISVKTFIEMKEENKKHPIKNKEYQIIKQLTGEISKRKMGEFIGVSVANELIAIAFFVKSKQRIIHLLSVSTPKGKEYAAPTFLFDNMIKEHANTNCIFDFEGSVIPGVARFFKGFGASENNYFLYKNT